MASQTIEKIEKAILSLSHLENLAKTSVERVDISDIRSDLQSALEKLEALRSYQESGDTDYDNLWEERKREVQEYQKSRDAWIRTEIFSHLLLSLGV